MNYEVINQIPKEEWCRYCTARHRCPNFNRPNYRDLSSRLESPICERYHPDRWFDMGAYERDFHLRGVRPFQFSANEHPVYKQQLHAKWGEVGEEMPKIERIVYNNPATIVWFADGEKVIVKCHNEKFDKEKGVAMAIARKLYTRSEFMRMVERGTEQNPNPRVEVQE